MSATPSELAREGEQALGGVGGGVDLERVMPDCKVGVPTVGFVTLGPTKSAVVVWIRVSFCTGERRGSSAGARRYQSHT